MYSGKFKIEYELNVGNHYTILDELDFIACPTGVERRFECLEAAPGKKEGLMLGIVSGDSTAAVPTVQWVLHDRGGHHCSTPSETAGVDA